MISAIQLIQRRLALGFLTLWAGCIAYAAPAPWVDCYHVQGPDPYCSEDFFWVPGYWGMDYYGQRVWHAGYYQRRMVVRDHRR